MQQSGPLAEAGNKAVLHPTALLVASPLMSSTLTLKRWNPRMRRKQTRMGRRRLEEFSSQSSSEKLWRETMWKGRMWISSKMRRRVKMDNMKLKVFPQRSSLLVILAIL